LFAFLIHSKGAYKAPASTPLGPRARPQPAKRPTSAGPEAAVRIEVAASPRPCLGCAVELALRIAPLLRGVPSR
jgi:hypothetical protein